MLSKKQGFPEENELVMCTVAKVEYHSVFAELDEYSNRVGMIHISEVSPGRIRNIRDFVREGKKIVCLVLRVNTEKGHIDLSLRRVNENMKRAKVDEIKKEQTAEKILEFAAKQNKKDIKALYDQVAEKALASHGTLYEFFEDVVANSEILQAIGIEKKLAADIEHAIRTRIKEAKVTISGKFKISSYEPDGVEIVKQAFKRAAEIGKDNLKVAYLGGGGYSLVVEAKDFKDAEKILKKTTEAITEEVTKTGGEAAFVRKEE